MYILHVHEALGVDVVVAYGCDRVGQGHWSSVRVVGHQLALPTATAPTATAGMAIGGGEHKVGVATAGSEDRVLSDNERLRGATAGGREGPCTRPAKREGGREEE